MGLTMDEPSFRSRPPQRGGGVFVAGGLILGAVGGIVGGQPSLGLGVGLGLGLLATIVLALVDRR
jgi:hypothetical protein